MTSSDKDVSKTKVHLCQVGNNFYQGQILKGRTYGYGTLFDANYEQFIIGVFQENQLIEVQTAQFISKNSICNLRKFKNHHLFDCEDENFLAQVIVTSTNIALSDSFDHIFKEICSGLEIVKIYEDDLSEKALDFCNDLEKSLTNVNWSKFSDNKPLEFFDFYQILMEFSIKCDSFELIKKLGSTPVIFGGTNQKRIALNNDIVKRNAIFKFSTVTFKVNMYQLLKRILEKTCEQYRSCLLEQNSTVLRPHIEKLDFPSLFLVRICDLKIFVKSQQIAMAYKIPFEISKVFELINEKGKITDYVAVPAIINCYPDLLKGLGVELTLLSEEIQIPYETLFGELIIQRKPIKSTSNDSLNYNLRKSQISYLRELLDYYKPGDSLKPKLYSGPHEDYSIHSATIKGKSTSFYDQSFKGKVFEDIRIWYDMLDLNIVELFNSTNKINHYDKGESFDFLKNYRGYFQAYATLIFDIFKKVFEEYHQNLCLYDFVMALTDVMCMTQKNLFEFSFDAEKSGTAMAILKSHCNSDVMQFITLMQQQIKEICSL